MRYLLDTGILLRLVNRKAAEHGLIRQAVGKVKLEHHECVASLQNLCEFWNVCTRPETSRGGLGLSFDEARHRLRTLERIISVLPDPPSIAERWEQLVFQYKVQGAQVHDTRLVAFMDANGIKSLISLNAADFRRFAHIEVLSPDEILAREAQ